MRKFASIVGIILSLLLIAAGVLGIIGTVKAVNEVKNASVELGDINTDDLEELLDTISAEVAPQLGLEDLLPEMSEELDAVGELPAAGEALAAANEELASVGEELAEGTALVLGLMVASAAVPLATSAMSYVIGWGALIIGLIFVGLVGLLVSLYGLGAACASKKQLKLLQQIAEKPVSAGAPRGGAPRNPAPARQAAAPAQTPRRAPAANPGVRAAVNPPSSVVSPAARQMPVSGKWSCNVCGMENSSDDEICVCCGEKRNGGAQPAAAANSWFCQTCGMQNSANAGACAVCGEARK